MTPKRYHRLWLWYEGLYENSFFRIFLYFKVSMIKTVFVVNSKLLSRIFVEPMNISVR